MKFAIFTSTRLFGGFPNRWRFLRLRRRHRSRRRLRHRRGRWGDGRRADGRLGRLGRVCQGDDGGVMLAHQKKFTFKSDEAFLSSSFPWFPPRKMWQKKMGPLDIKVAGKKWWQPAQTFCLLGASYFWKESVEERFIDLFPAVYLTEKSKFVRLAVESISLILIKIKIADSFLSSMYLPFLNVLLQKYLQNVEVIKSSSNQYWSYLPTINNPYLIHKWFMNHPFIHISSIN